jgi:hypothetical protein
VAYETFERQSVRIEEPAIAIAPDGKIALNAAATRIFEEAKIQAVKILWDKTKCGIALTSEPKNDISAFSIAFGDRHSQATLTAKTFLRYIGWTADHRQTVRAKWDAQQKMLEAELPPRFVDRDKGSKPGSIPPTPDAMDFSNNDDPYGGNVNNRNADERKLNDHLIHASDTERVRANIAKSKSLNPGPAKTGR